MNIGVIIPSHGLADKLEKAIDHLLASDTTHEIVLAVVDNATPDTSVHDVCRKSTFFDEGMIYVRMPWNTSFARANNFCAMIMGQVDAYLFLNNDCYLEPDALHHMVEALKQGKGDIIGAKLYFPDMTIQHAGGEIVGDFDGVCHRHPPNETSSCRTSWVTGACMLVRAESFIRCGTFDEGYVNGYEDVDLCLKFRDRGLMTYYCAEAVGVHEEGQTPGRKDMENENATKFFTKYRPRNADDYR